MQVHDLLNSAPAARTPTVSCMPCEHSKQKDRSATYAEALAFGVHTRDAILHQVSASGPCVPCRRQFCPKCGKPTLLIHVDEGLHGLAHTANFERLYLNMAAHVMN